MIYGDSAANKARGVTDIVKKIIYKIIALLVLGLALCSSGCMNERAQLTLKTEESTDDTDESTDGEALDSEDKNSDSGQLSVTPQAASQTQEFIYVDICGAVVNPGVYELDSDSRVFQVIEAAGGFLPEASSSSVNQAQSVTDGQQIYVPTEQEVEDGTYSTQAATTQSSESASSDSGMVNINTADADTLKTLSGIGDAKAQAIIAYRNENGAFGSIEDIMQVPGIKESTYASIKDKIAVQ